MITIRRKLLRRSLSLLLSFIICLSAVGAAVFAETTTQTLISVEKINVPLEDGVYYADVDLWNATANQASMGNAALRGSTSFKLKQPDDTYSKSVIVVKDNKATALVEFMPMGYIGMYGFMMELESVDVRHLTQYGGVYDGDATFTPATVLARHMTQDGEITYDAYNNPDSEYVFNGQKTRPAGFGHEQDRTVDISDVPYSHILALDVTPIVCGGDAPASVSEYTWENAAYVHVFVPVMFAISASSGDQYARMMVDWTSAEKIEEPEKNLQYCLWSAKQIEQGNYTSASYAALQNAIDEITVRLENIWPDQTITMSGAGFNAVPTLEQKEYSDSEKAEMTEKLNTAILALEEKGEKGTLNTMIERANKLLEELYTAESYAGIGEALTQALTVQNNEDASVSEVAGAVSVLEAALQALVYKGADYTAVNAAIDGIPENLFSVCTAETAQAVQDAQDAVDWTLDVTEQSKVDEYAVKIQEAISGLVYLGADYSKVTAAIAEIPEDLSVYTDETVQAVRDAQAAVDWAKSKTEQSLVDGYADAIEDAVGSLAFKPADYSAVDAALANIPEDLSVYTEESVRSLQDAQNAAVRGKNITEQSDVDAMAEAINAAIAGLELASNALDKNNLEDGVYSIYGEMVKVNRQDKSMSNDAINHTMKLTVENGMYYLTIDFHGLHYLNRFGYLAKLSYYDNGYTYGQYGKIEGTLVLAEVLTTQKNSDGSDVIDEFNQAGGSSEGLLYPDQLKFPLVSDALNDADGFVPLHVFVPVMEDISGGTGDQDVLLQLDWSTLKKTTEDDPDFEPDKPIELSPEVEAVDPVTGVKVHADKGVFEEGVELVVTPITSGSDYDKTISALEDVGTKFVLYDIHFEDADGNEVQPNGTVTVSYPVPAGYNTDRIVLYRINDDGSKTLIKGEVRDGYYTVITRSFSTYALVEKAGSVVTNGQDATNVNNSTAGNDNGGNNNNDHNTINSSQTKTNNSQTKTDNPKTGDNGNSALYFLLALASAGMIGMLTVTRKHRGFEGE